MVLLLGCFRWVVCLCLHNCAVCLWVCVLVPAETTRHGHPRLFSVLLRLSLIEPEDNQVQQPTGEIYLPRLRSQLSPTLILHLSCGSGFKSSCLHSNCPSCHFPSLLMKQVSEAWNKTMSAQDFSSDLPQYMSEWQRGYSILMFMVRELLTLFQRSFASPHLHTCPFPSFPIGLNHSFC